MTASTASCFRRPASSRACGSISSGSVAPMKGVMGLRDRAERAFAGQLPQPVEREDDIPVFLEPGAVEIDRDVADQQLVRPGVGRDDPIVGIAAAKRVLAVLDKAGGGNDRHPTLRQPRSGHPGSRFEIRAFQLGQAFCLRRRQIGQSRHGTSPRVIARRWRRSVQRGRSSPPHSQSAAR